MKKCPQCDKTYDDTWGVCVNDKVPLAQLEPDEKPELLQPSKEMLTCYDNLLKYRRYSYILFLPMLLSIFLFDFNTYIGTAVLSISFVLVVITRWRTFIEMTKLQSFMDMNATVGNVILAFLFCLEAAMPDTIRDFKKKYAMKEAR